MAFSQGEIASVSSSLADCELYICWTSTAPAGSIYQVYVNEALVWHGKSTRCRVPIPMGASGKNTWIEVGVVDPGEECTDFSASLTGRGSGERARLAWLGGTYLAPDAAGGLQGFAIYQSSLPGAPINYTAAVAQVPAYPGGWIADGFGLSGFGWGGFGRSACSYEWTSDALATGTWGFAIVPIDRAGDPCGPPQTASVSLQVAPRPPAPSGGARLSYTYSGSGSRSATLSWSASPA